jgi:apolipoprotein N-acyltransferase
MRSPLVSEARVSRATTRAQPQTAPRRTASSPAAVWPLLPASVSGALLYLCYFPLSWGFLAWFALVPLLCLVRTPARPWTVYLGTFAGGVALYMPVLHWFSVAHPLMVVAWLFLIVLCTLYWVLAIYLVRLLDRRTALPLVLTFPAVWTAVELLRSHCLTGFGWYLLAHTQHDFLALIQVSDLTGAYGVTFLIAAVNVVLFEMLYARDGFRTWLCPGRAPLSKLALLRQAFIVFVVLMATLGYGIWRLGEESQTPGPTVAVLKGTDPQPFRNARSKRAREGDDGPEPTEQHFQHLCNAAARLHPDLIVWPETSLPGEVRTAASGVRLRDLDPAWRSIVRKHGDMISEAYDYWHTPILLGLNVREWGPNGDVRRYNSALLVNAATDIDGANGLVRRPRYDKMHAVPLGEYVPLRQWCPWMEKLTPYEGNDYSISEGERATRFPLTVRGTGYTFGALICSESTDAVIGRAYGGGDSQPPADFLIEMSNDAWFDGTTQPQEHLAVTRFRAIEARRSIARAVNYGVPSIIDSKGRVLRPLPVPLGEHLALLSGDAQSGTLAGFPWAGLALCREKPCGWYVPPVDAGATEWPIGEWGRYNQTPGVLLASMPIDRRVSLYALYGDWLPWSCWGVVALGVVLALFRPVRRPAPLPVEV